MQLLVVHQILIASAIGLCAIFGLRSLIVFARGGDTVELALAGAAVAVGTALVFYLRKVRARWRMAKERS